MWKSHPPQTCDPSCKASTICDLLTSRTGDKSACQSVEMPPGKTTVGSYTFEDTKTTLASNTCTDCWCVYCCIHYYGSGRRILHLLLGQSLHLIGRYWSSAITFTTRAGRTRSLPQAGDYYLYYSGKVFTMGSSNEETLYYSCRGKDLCSTETILLLAMAIAKSVKCLEVTIFDLVHLYKEPRCVVALHYAFYFLLLVNLLIVITLSGSLNSIQCFGRVVEAYTQRYLTKTKSAQNKIFKVHFPVCVE